MLDGQRAKKNNQWYMYDDENVVKMSEEDILKLSGGGDWHTAYCLFYSPRKLEAKYLELKAQTATDSTEIPMETKIN